MSLALPRPQGKLCMASSCRILLVHLGLCGVLPRKEGAGDATGISKHPEEAGWFLFKAAEEAPEDSRGCTLPCKPGEILVSGVAADPVPDSSDMVVSVKCQIQPPHHLWVNLLLAPPPEHAGAETSPESPKSRVMSGAPNPDLCWLWSLGRAELRPCRPGLNWKGRFTGAMQPGPSLNPGRVPCLALALGSQKGLPSPAVGEPK